MPGESVAAYINNTVTFIIFTLICIAVFALLYAVSACIRKRVLTRSGDKYASENGKRKIDCSCIVDPYKKRNSALLGMSFVFVVLSLLLMLSVLYFSLNKGPGLIIGLISFIIYSMIAVLVYMFRSGLIKK
jgi:hypothetical protein